MDSAKLNDWLQVFGIFALVASLIFVGLQMKQDHEIAIANQYQIRFDSISDYLSSVIQSETAMRVQGKRALQRVLKSSGFPDSVKEWASDQPDDELAFWLIEAYRVNKSFDNHYYQYEAGFISEESWGAFRAELKRDLSREDLGHRHYFLMNPGVWRQSYREMMYKVIAEIDSE